MKGASGTKPCLMCKNIVARLDLPAHPYLRTLTTANTSECDLHSDQSFQEMVDTLLDRASRGSQAELRRLEQAFGVNLELQGLPFDRALRRVLPGPASSALFDWMHTLVANGVATWEICGLVQELRCAGISVIQVDAWISLHTLPKRLGKLPESFLQQRCSEDTLKAFACEVLALLPVLLAFMRNVVAPSGALPQHCKCFELLCRIVGILQQGDVACRKAPVLADLVHAHAALYAELYKDLVRPKCHYLLHLASQLQHLQVNVSCFVTERKHREVKRLAATTFSHFEASLCANHLNEQIEKLTDPTNRIYHPVRLEAAPRTHTHTHAHTQRTRTPAHTHTRTHTHTHPHTDTDEHTRAHKHTHTHTHIYIYTHAQPPEVSGQKRSSSSYHRHYHRLVIDIVSGQKSSASSFSSSSSWSPSAAR